MDTSLLANEIGDGLSVASATSYKQSTTKLSSATSAVWKALNEPLSRRYMNWLQIFLSGWWNFIVTIFWLNCPMRIHLPFESAWKQVGNRDLVSSLFGGSVDLFTL